MKEKGRKAIIESEIKKREELYKKIKQELIPLIVESIKKEEKVRGHISYWNLFNELVQTNAPGLAISDYERIIMELKEKRLIEREWSAGTCGGLKMVR